MNLITASVYANKLNKTREYVIYFVSIRCYETASFNIMIE